MSKYGFIKVSRDVNQAISHPQPATPQALVDLPTTPVAQFVHEYARQRLPQETFNHSLRVYQYSVAIIHDQFPQWDLDHEVLYVTSLLHDIGTTDENVAATRLSFEFYGGIISRDLILQQTKGDQDYADAVAEAIIRHQDLGDSGYITSLGLILQIATIYDNIGANVHLIHEDTAHAVNKTYSRKNWNTCFAASIDKENLHKPWGHTSALGVEEFRDSVLHNKHVYEKQ